MHHEVTRARRLLSLAETALLQAEATRRAVETLLAEVGTARAAPLAPQAPTAPPARPGPTASPALDSARLVAIEMAVAGRSREEVGAHVRHSFELVDVDALLDDVFGPVAAA